jgi:hypothetical protein
VFRAPWREAPPARRDRPRAPAAQQSRFIVDWVARRASPRTVASSPRATPCPARPPWRGAQSFPGDVGNGSRMEARQGAIRIFFGNPGVLRSAPHPAIRLHLMRDPVSHPLGRPQRERAGLLALREFARSRIRCSWRLGPVCFRQTSSQADDGMSTKGLLKKFCHGPSLRPHHRRNPTFHARCPTRNGEAPHRLRGCRRTTAEPRRRATARLARNQIHEEPQFPSRFSRLPRTMIPTVARRRRTATPGGRRATGQIRAGPGPRLGRERER